MTTRAALLVLLFSFLAPACGDDDPAPQDAATDAASDTGDDATDDAGGDAGSDDAGGDGGLDCATVGCAAAPVCGEACSSACGCCPCTDGDIVVRDGKDYVCAGECFVEDDDSLNTTCETVETCGDGMRCCYPCGIEGCENRCEPACDEGEPACANGCFLRP